ncbi:hypothetical protein HZA42_00775 [Candidatus Peregrinibacteria bacterium]|nr:hypothetical protein [Candidatus Peregrinibacteria bacterium]
MYHRTPLSVESKKVLKLLMCTIFGLLIVISVYFFIKTSYTAEKGYAMREAQLKLNELESKNRILKQQVLDAQSLSEVQASDTIKRLEQSETQIFVEEKGPVTRR